LSCKKYQEDIKPLENNQKKQMKQIKSKEWQQSMLNLSAE